MKGYPKNLNTKADYEYVKANFAPEEYLPDFQSLLDTMYDWFFVKELTSEEEGITDDTHKVIVSKEERPATVEGEEQTIITTYAQYEYRINPTCKLHALGYTEEEVRAVVNGG